MAWFRRPFIISWHEFDFTIGLFNPAGVQSSIPVLVSGGLIHIALVGWLTWAYYRIVMEAARSDSAFSSGDWKHCLVLMVPFFFYLPWLSPDVFYYLASGWIQTAHHLDPCTDLIDTSPDYPSHPVHLNNLFPRITTLYGPLFSLLMRG